jgi:hypothetical protein
MITEYILHPFGHLTGGRTHHAALATMQHGPEMHALPAMQRRVIFLDIATNNDGPMTSPQDDFAINARRMPLFFVDVHLHTAEFLQVRDLPEGSGWGTVPTPMFRETFRRAVLYIFRDKASAKDLSEGTP